MGAFTASRTIIVICELQDYHFLLNYQFVSTIQYISQQRTKKMEKVETNGDAINVNIKFGGRTIPVSLSSDSTVRDLKSLLQPLTNVLPRGQKLIFKGKVLADESTLKSSKVSNGVKIMLMASQGLHQGDGPIKKEMPAPSNLRRNANANQVKEKREVTVEKSRTERWKATGVIALSECNLRVYNIGHYIDKSLAFGLSSASTNAKSSKRKYKFKTLYTFVL